MTIEGGAYLVIDRTEALTVIDVNTGRFVGGKDLEDTVFRTNIAAADEVARQLRMRNISGIVIVDFIDMQSDEHRKAVVERLREDLKRDRLKTSAVSMTGLGLVELTRKRTRLSADTLMLGCGESHHREGASLRGGAGVPLRHHDAGGAGTVEGQAGLSRPGRDSPEGRTRRREQRRQGAHAARRRAAGAMNVLRNTPPCVIIKCAALPRRDRGEL